MQFVLFKPSDKQTVPESAELPEIVDEVSGDDLKSLSFLVLL